MTPEELKERFHYQLESWIYVLGSMPVGLIATADKSEPYEMNEGHVFKLENGKFAVVLEQGCSCYDSSEASIELHPTEAKAMEKFREWEKQ